MGVGVVFEGETVDRVHIADLTTLFIDAKRSFIATGSDVSSPTMACRSQSDAWVSWMLCPSVGPFCAVDVVGSGDAFTGDLTGVGEVALENVREVTGRIVTDVLMSGATFSSETSPPRHSAPDATRRSRCTELRAVFPIDSASAALLADTLGEVLAGSAGPDPAGEEDFCAGVLAALRAFLATTSGLPEPRT